MNLIKNLWVLRRVLKQGSCYVRDSEPRVPEPGSYIALEAASNGITVKKLKFSYHNKDIQIYVRYLYTPSIVEKQLRFYMATA